MLVERAEDDQKWLRSLVAKSRNFSDLEKRALDVDSATSFEAFWASTGVARQGFQQAHNSGSNRQKFSRNAMHFASTAHDILRSLTPLVDFIKDIGGPYGALAIGTITFVLAVSLFNAIITLPRCVLTALDCQE